MEGEIGIIMKMRSMYDSLSKSEKKIVSYIMDHPDEVIHLSVTGLAENSGVSDATVVRTCRKLGMTGYQDLKVSLAQSMVSPIKSINEDIEDGDTPAQMIRKVFGSTIHTLNYTMDVLNFRSVEEAAEVIRGARRILIFGLGNSHSMALDMQHKLMRLGLSAVAYADTHMQIIAATSVQADDVLIVISHSGSSKDVVEAAKLCRDRGVKIIAITNIGRTPLSKIADITLVTASKETEFKISALSSRAAQMVIIDSIYTLIAMEGREEITERFLLIDEWLKKKKY